MNPYQLEQLESRLMLAASMNLRNNGTLLIKGDASDDTIHVVGTGTPGSVDVHWDVDGDGITDQSQTFNGVKHITIRGGAGDDTFVIEDVDIAGNLKIFGNRGDDYGTIENSTIGGKTNFNGQHGHDTFVDLGGNTFGSTLKFVSENQPTIEPTDSTDSTDSVKELKAHDDTYATHDNYSFSVNLVDNDTSFATTAITQISTGSLSDSTYNMAGELELKLEHGNVKVAKDGTMTYTPTDLAAGLNVSDTFTYTLTDVLGNTSTATVTIDVDGNDAHVPMDDASLTNAYDINEPFDLFENDSGDTNGQVSYFHFTSTNVITYSPTPLVAAGGTMEIIARANTAGLTAGDRIGTISISADGELTFTPDEHLTDKLTSPTMFEVHYFINNGLEEFGGDHAKVTIVIQNVG